MKNHSAKSQSSSGRGKSGVSHTNARRVSSVPPASYAAAGLLQMSRAYGNRATANYLRSSLSGDSGTSSASQPVAQASFNKMESSYKQDYTVDDLKTAEGDDGKFTSVSADSGLPTFYGVIKHTYGANVNDNWFQYTNKLGATCDRPHSVTARVKKSGSAKDRQDSQEVTAIGNLGYEEMQLREGNRFGRKTTYNGGHLIGYQIVRGPEADNEWNVAPQDTINNQQAYNNTIEQMLREADIGTVYDYTVDVRYDQLNFSVDQDQLLGLGVLTAIDSNKPWEIQVPVRVPYKWDADAKLVKGQFGNPVKKDGSSYKQYSAAMNEAELNYYDESTSARFHLKYSDGKGAEADHDVNTSLTDTTGIQGIHFSMFQQLPTDFLKNTSPSSQWISGYANQVADYGDVSKGLAAEVTGIDLIHALKLQNQAIYQKINSITEAPTAVICDPAVALEQKATDMEEEHLSHFIGQWSENQGEAAYIDLQSVYERLTELYNVKSTDESNLVEESKKYEEIDKTHFDSTTDPAVLQKAILTLKQQKSVLMQILNNREERQRMNQTAQQFVNRFNTITDDSLRMATADNDKYVSISARIKKARGNNRSLLENELKPLKIKKNLFRKKYQRIVGKNVLDRKKNKGGIRYAKQEWVRKVIAYHRKRITH
ncbi:hypothetical protein [Paenibacillus sp. y28]|uniref:hypothetical protein n=1 Tax=Paenibacillus sp. y28 TaxID=3129110 RepID=UPI003017C893